MKKTIILGTNNQGQTLALEGVMAGALSFGYVVGKYTKVFESKKQAQEELSSHPCRKGLKYYTLNEKQISVIETINQTEGRFFVKLTDFLQIKE